jgi:hypothetical protein
VGEEAEAEEEEAEEEAAFVEEEDASRLRLVLRLLERICFSSTDEKTERNVV